MPNPIVAFFNDRDISRSIWTAIGVGAIAGVVLPELRHFFAFIRLHFLHRSKLSRYQHVLKNASISGSKKSRDRAWALVTGASDGIGYGFVQQLAAKSFNVILHGRNKVKINGLIEKLRKEFPDTEFDSWICDASDRGAWSSALEELLAKIKQQGINLTILVNNVGGTTNFDTLGVYELDRLNALVDMNAVFPAQMTRALLPTLMENKPSLIINMSSVGGIVPLPYICAYNASKAFNRHLSNSVAMELLAEGHDEVEVLSIIAGSVQSAGMTVDASIGVPTSKAFAGSVLGLVGCGRPEVVGWWLHAIQLWVMGTLMPEWLRRIVAVKAMNATKIACAPKVGLESKGEKSQ